jgi:hypothetical protein
LPNRAIIIVMNTDTRSTFPVLAGTILAGLFALQAVTAEAQQRGGNQARAMAMGTNPLFAERAPEIGDPLPDLTIVDDMGNPVNIRDLASENYTVLVLGCLT